MDIFLIKKIKILQVVYQIILMLILLGIMLSLECLLFLWQPMEKLKRTNDCYLSLSQQFHRQNQLIQKQDDIKKTLLELNNELSDIDIYKENHLNEIITQLTMHATENQLQNISIKPEVISEDNIVMLQMHVVGSYTQFIHFLLSINKISYAINMKSLSIEKNNDPKALDINLQFRVS